MTMISDPIICEELLRDMTAFILVAQGVVKQKKHDAHDSV